MLYCTVPFSSTTNSQNNANPSYNLAHVFELFNDKKEKNELKVIQ